MQGLGNSFIVFEGPREVSSSEVVALCEAYTTDGLLVVSRVAESRIKMQYWNNDGSLAEMCGNGLRCSVRFAIERKLVEPGEVTVSTGAGLLRANWSGHDEDGIEAQIGRVVTDGKVVIDGATFFLANVGNPHAVTIVHDVDVAKVTSIGPKVEVNDRFPRKTNVEFVQPVNASLVKMRVWERGVGETSACGTGMVASAGVVVKEGLASYPLTIVVPGGEARVWLDSEGYSWMRAPAQMINEEE